EREKSKCDQPNNGSNEELQSHSGQERSGWGEVRHSARILREEAPLHLIFPTRATPPTCTSLFLTPFVSTGAPAGSSAASGSNRRLQQTQNQVDEVVDIMRVNVDKVLERDQKLSELDDRADALQAGASQFETSAAKLKRKYWWKNCKMWAIGIVVVVVIIIIIIVWNVSP
uniref:Vesicle associated membrane protein 3 n=2 Tax=Felis catus TaxID=9685 RepID=A0ABI8A3L0_FELCA